MPAIKTTVKLRCDTLSNWEKSTIKLLDGEVCVVKDADENVMFKVGDGIHTFDKLPYINDKKVSTILLNAC
jgi:hypothetical protein